MSVLTFIVQPGGASYDTHICPISYKPSGEGFYHAHLHAARQAAQTKGPAWVLRADTGDERCGFGLGAAWTSTTVLYEINQLGLHAFWDYNTTSWLPIESSEEDIEVGTQLEAVL